MRSACSFAATAALALLVHTARAQDADPSAGRIQGDLTLVAAAGGVVASGGPRGEAEVRVRYLDSAGVFASYEDGPVVGSSSAPRRVLAAGFELRPLFLARWLQGRELRRARLDLTIDSLGLELAAVWTQPAGESFAAQSGLQAGLGLEVPVLAQAAGPWVGVHAGVRWSDAALASGTVHGADDREGFVSITLAWHQVVVAHVVDVGDRAPE